MSTLPTLRNYGKTRIGNNITWEKRKHNTSSVKRFSVNLKEFKLLVLF